MDPEWQVDEVRSFAQGTIQVRRGDFEYHAWMTAEPKFWAPGKTSTEAIGYLLVNITEWVTVNFVN